MIATRIKAMVQKTSHEVMSQAETQGQGKAGLYEVLCIRFTW